jgi:hypothetical protein
MNKRFEIIMALLQNWDTKAAEGLLASAADVERVRKQMAAAAAWGVCKLAEPVGGDGKRDSSVKLLCERGNLFARVSVNPETNRVTSLDLVPTRDQRCVP